MQWGQKSLEIALQILIIYKSLDNLRQFPLIQSPLTPSPLTPKELSKRALQKRSPNEVWSWLRFVVAWSLMGVWFVESMEYFQSSYFNGLSKQALQKSSPNELSKSDLIGVCWESTGCMISGIQGILSASKAVISIGSPNWLSKKVLPMSFPNQTWLESAWSWESSGSPLGARLESAGSLLRVCWESAGSPLGVR